MKKLHVLPEKCIACGKCYLNYPKVFDCTDDGVAFVIQKSSLSQQEESERAIYDCPTKAIKWLDDVPD
ncbi:ferredoxin [Tuanshanicoccus lijuaniae]|uniref:ferredoxin n=1 Tax=Aerococcaceae bacterium zg-1292 TaxID=2774330 RepID=UPI0019373F5D|nr:ferredoxin [Aerococcaceae bacterium zg-1292]MBF6625517.1 ferredoxin [Aerococcaceae bacterium zg-BR9]MBF6977704.1 ferredoxin [Aerococcaceae bacterium zg-BR22]MBS4456633.1 ferredoxin [Aerococcaceae bacterium zg-A91]MBS4458425.1 ferredoxin [Aerococcaceae bacterium zg-BR33]